MSNSRDRARTLLARLKPRIERLRKEPANASRFVDKLIAPVYRLARWKAKFETEYLQQFLEHVSDTTGQASGQFVPIPRESRPLIDGMPADASLLYFRALAELKRNVRIAELGARVHGRIPALYAVWLSHIAVALERLLPILEGEVSSWDWARARAIAKGGIAAPLTSTLDAAAGADPFAVARFVTIDSLIGAALAETDRLDRRRNLLEAARRLVIEANASMALLEEGAKSRQDLIARELRQIGRLEAAGITPRVSFLHQLREARERGEWERLHAGLVGLEELGLRLNEDSVGQLAHRALKQIWRGRGQNSDAVRGESVLKSVHEMFGTDALDRVRSGIDAAKAAFAADGGKSHYPGIEEETLGFIKNHLEALETSLFVNGLLSVDGTFDVGGVLTPTRVVEEYQRQVAVRYPTAQLALMPAEGPQDIPDCMIEDPRTVLPSLASGKLLARRFVKNEVKTIKRTALVSELRIYLLDGSTSMLTRRAVLRDSILIAELCTLIERLNTVGRSVRPMLYFQYFNTKVGPVTEVKTAGEAASAIASLLSTVQTGGTNIQAAMLRSIEQIREAQGAGIDLARANIVLITDGESPIDETEVVEALESLGELRTTLNIFALGVENPSLGALVRAQKARGRRAFYQYVADESILEAITGKGMDACLHPPTGVELGHCVDLLQDTLDEIVATKRAQEPNAESDAFLEQSLDALEDDGALRAALQGRMDVARRDREALAKRFKKWFFEPGHFDASQLYEPDTETEAQISATKALLESIVEVSVNLGGEPWILQADAIEIFQRGLYELGISPLDYVQLLQRFPSRFREPIDRLYQTVGLASTSVSA